VISTGIIVEYNPFHNGHLHHIREARRLTGADCIIAVMSGYFMQRGEPALVSKWARAEMAVLCGADLVVELPYAFAVQQAESFGSGGIAILDALQCRNFCFGSESGDIEKFRRAVSVLLKNESVFNTYVRCGMKNGISYPQALANSLNKLGAGDVLDLSSPNNILGFHYMLAAAKQNTGMEAFTVARKSAQHHDEAFADETIASATAIRKTLMRDNDPASIRTVVPKQSYALLTRCLKETGTFHHWGIYWPFLRYRLISASHEELRNIYEVEEGIEYRLKKAAIAADDFESFMKKVKTKRYTWTRIQRMCTHILTNTTKDEMKRHAAKPEYIRLLAMNEKGRAYLHRIKKNVPVPVVSKFSASLGPLIELDSRAAQIYALPLTKNGRDNLLHREYSRPPLMVGEPLR